MRETGTGEQVAQIHDRYMVMMMMMIVNKVSNLNHSLFINCIIKATKLSVFSFIQKICGIQKLKASVQVKHYLILIWKRLNRLFIW